MVKDYMCYWNIPNFVIGYFEKKIINFNIWSVMYKFCNLLYSLKLAENLRV